MLNAVKGWRRVVSSYATHPRLQTSAANPYLSPFKISGDMKCGVPTAEDAWLSSFTLASLTRARPKSPSRTSPSEVRKTLPGLTSLWMTRLPWR